tara:strand:+ start:309 stop:1271 length:963 start_codon:yes stop_codon:yes gene_type:complete
MKKTTNINKKKATGLLNNSKDMDWYHKFEVVQGSGVFTPGRLDTKGYKWRRNFIGLTEEFLQGKRVLDIGAYSGAFSFLMQDLGAEVVAADVYDPDYNGFNLVKEIRGRPLRHERVSVYDLDPEEIGKFDIVAFYGVHYHLKHPMLALERCNSVCKQGGLLIGGGTGLDAWFHESDESCLNGVNLGKVTKEIINNLETMSVENLNELPLCGFSPDHFLKDKTNWFIPNLKCLLGWVEASGFEVIESQKTSSPIDRDWNKDKRVNRTTLNYKSVKTGPVKPEYTWKRMAPYQIPTQFELLRLNKEIKVLKAVIEKLNISQS